MESCSGCDYYSRCTGCRRLQFSLRGSIWSIPNSGKTILILGGKTVADDNQCIGNSFPSEDQYGRFLIQESMRSRLQKRGDKPTIEFYELKRTQVNEPRQSWKHLKTT